MKYSVKVKKVIPENRPGVTPKAAPFVLRLHFMNFPT